MLRIDKEDLPPTPSSVEQGTALPSFRDRETFSLSSAPLFASVEQGTALPSFRDRETFSLSSAPSFAFQGGE